MIIKSFLRHKSTKIYLAIITVLLLSISLLFATSNYLENANNEAYYRISLFYMESKEDKYNDLINDKNFINVKKTLKLEYHDTIIENEDISEFELDNMVLTYADDNNKYNLKDNEVVIVFSNNRYDNNEPYFDNYMKSNINFILGKDDITLTIKKIEKDNRGKIFISKSLFDKLKKISNQNIYTANFINEDIANKYYSNFEKADENQILNLDIETNLKYREKMKRNLKTVQYASFIGVVIIFIIVILVNKNIISDLNPNIKLENILGYSKSQIRLNLFKRLSVLHLMSYVISALMGLIPIMSLKVFIGLNIDFSYIISTIILETIILLCDLLLIIIVNNKSKNTIERRKIL